MKRTVLWMLVSAWLLTGAGCGADVETDRPGSLPPSGSGEASGDFLPSVSDRESSPAQSESATSPTAVPKGAEGREIITLGTCAKVESWSPMSTAVTAFNQAQERYFLELKQYDSVRNFSLDIARKQGCDLFELSSGRIGADIYAAKGVLEDLSPYFENGGAGGKENIVEAVWRAGSLDGQLFFVIPFFRTRGILVEKGYTAEGAWTGEDFLALAEKYPENMLNSNVKRPVSQLMTYLNQWVGVYIDWEERTCRFDSEEFTALLERLKELSERSYLAADESLAEAIRNGEYLTEAVTLGSDFQMNLYKDLRDTFFDVCEFAGVPTADGTLRYDMYYDQLYAMNSASDNKEGAWAFLEFLLSEEWQEPISPQPSANQTARTYAFPARKDQLEKLLRQNMEYEPGEGEQNRFSVNSYTKERVAYRSFTQEDKDFLLKVIDNSFREAFITDQTPLNIIIEETEAFFKGQKSAAEAARIIQSRVSLYLSE